MSGLEVINSVTAIVGVPITMGSLLFVGRKLQILDSLDETTKTIKHNLTVVTRFLTKHHQEFNPSELQAFSPLHLTEVGEELINTFGFDQVFASNKLMFFQFIDNETPKFKYDVELSAIKSVIALSDEPFMSFLKIYLYNNPTRSLDNISPTLGIYIRDRYLSAHPEITQ